MRFAITLYYSQMQKRLFQRYTQFQWSSTSSPPWSTSRWMTSWIGRTETLPSAPQNTAVLLSPSLPTCSSITRAFFHVCLGRWSSWRRTMSPTRNLPDLLYGWETSWNFLNSRRYSFSQRFQKSSVSFCVLWCAFVRFLSFCGSVPGGNVVNLSSQRKWAGVNASSMSWVMALEFRASSVLTRVVAKSSSVACDRPNTFRRHLFVMCGGARL